MNIASNYCVNFKRNIIPRVLPPADVIIMMITQVRVATVVDITGRRLQLAYDDNGAEQVSTSISKWRLQ